MTEPCIKCGKRPRLGGLRRCKPCLQADAAAQQKPKAQGDTAAGGENRKG